MSFNAFPFVVSWAMLACFVLGLAAYKLTLYMITSRQDFAPHIVTGQTHSAENGVIAHREELLDRWGKILTVVAIAYGLMISVAYLYSSLQHYPGKM